MALLDDDDRIECSVERVQTADGKYRNAKLWRPSRAGVDLDLSLDADGV